MRKSSRYIPFPSHWILQLMFSHRCCATLGVWFVIGAATMASPMKALIVDGQNNHDWKGTTPLLRRFLEETGLFVVDVATSPPHGRDMSGFKPEFAAYQVVVSNYNGDDWPVTTKKALEKYLAGGGGLVILHAADNAFPRWKEYNELIGIGFGRTEKDGPSVYWQDGQMVRDSAPSDRSSHGFEHPFQIVVRDREHPITRGLPEKFMQATDELYARLRGPAKNLTVLATAFSDPATLGTGYDEPALMTVGYGKGRVFHTILGHAMKRPFRALESVAFIVTFQRGTQWAATGRVTQKVPADFPGPDQPRLRGESARSRPANPWVVYDGYDGPGKGKQIVLVSGDEEYRSEEALPQLGKILAKHHGFKCTVLFAIDPGVDAINPNDRANIPGLEALRTADLMIIFTRFRDLPDEQMKYIVEYVEAGKPIMGMRTATHAFAIAAGKTYAKYGFQSRNGSADSAAKSSAKHGSTITATTEKRAREALSPRVLKIIRSSAAARIFGDRRTFTACGCRFPATPKRWCWARCWPA